jgi:hypothetical protein
MSTVATKTGRKTHKKPVARPLTFGEWKQQVNAVMAQMCGLRLDAVDESFGVRERFESGADVVQTARDAYNFIPDEILDDIDGDEDLL